MSYNVKGLAGELTGHNNTDGDGNPVGGTAMGRGFVVEWQNGPLGRGDERQEPNGAFVEDVIQTAIIRLKFYQGEPVDPVNPYPESTGKYKCRENALAITHLQEALHWLEARTKEREQRKVEGTHLR